MEPPAKRRRPQLKIPESKEEAAEEAQFIRADLYARDWDCLDFVIDFLASGIDMARLAIYNTIMAPLSDIITSSESTVDTAPASFT